MSLLPSAGSFIMMLLFAEVTPSLFCLPPTPGPPTFLIECYHGEAAASQQPVLSLCLDLGVGRGGTHGSLLRLKGPLSLA